MARRRIGWWLFPCILTLASCTGVPANTGDTSGGADDRADLTRAESNEDLREGGAHREGEAGEAAVQTDRDERAGQTKGSGNANSESADRSSEPPESGSGESGAARESAPESRPAVTGLEPIVPPVSPIPEIHGEDETRLPLPRIEGVHVSKDDDDPGRHEPSPDERGGEERGGHEPGTDEASPTKLDAAESEPDEVSWTRLGSPSTPPGEESRGLPVELPVPREPVVVDPAVVDTDDGEPTGRDAAAATKTSEPLQTAEGAPEAEASAEGGSTDRAGEAPPVETSESTVRELPPIAIRLSRVGVTVPVSLPGVGWIFTGSGDDSGYRYRGRDFGDDETVFSFLVEEPRDYELHFQRQDSTTGSFETAVVELFGAEAASSPDTRPGPLVSSPGPADRVDTAEGSGADAAESLRASAAAAYERGAYGQALEAFERLIASGHTDLHLEAARAAAGAGAHSRVVEWYARELSEGDQPLPYADALALIEALEDGGDPAPMVSGLPGLLDRGVLEYREDILRLAEVFRQTDMTVSEVRVLGHALERFGAGLGGDEVLFRLGSAFERESRLRDERVAHRYYKRLVENYPMSRYYEKAEARIAYIERHYLNIR